MTDIVSKQKRSKMMSGIRGKNTKPELLVRSELHKLGFRFRIHNKDLPGKPDLVLKKYNAIVFVHGCFWHRHDCYLFKWPKTNKRFWKEKINKNYSNDCMIVKKLSAAGWRVCIVWECALRGKKKDVPSAINRIADWLVSKEDYLEISG